MSSPEIAESYRSMVELCEQLYEFKPPESPLNEFGISLVQAPDKVRREVAASPLGNMLFKNGQSMGIEDGGDYYPDIDLRIEDTSMRAVGLYVLKSTYPSYTKVGDDYVESGTEALYKLSLRFAYTNEAGNYASEEVGLEIGSENIQSAPAFYSQLWALDYAETGYEGHGGDYRRPTQKEALGAVAVMGDLFAAELQHAINTKP